MTFITDTALRICGDRPECPFCNNGKKLCLQHVLAEYFKMENESKNVILYTSKALVVQKDYAENTDYDEIGKR